MLIAQISDLHICTPAPGGVDTPAFLPPLLASVQRVQPRPDCVLATGDLVNGGGAAEYALLREALAGLDIPCYLIPGNHDERSNLRAAFADHAYLPQDGQFIQYTVEDYPLRLIALDTVVAQQVHGELCAARLDWLAARLAEQPQRPSVIFMHHPPFATGIQSMDAIGLRTGAPELQAMVQRYPNVERVLCGHLHRTIFQRFGGTIASTAPASAHQIALDLASEARVSLVMEPPAYHLHLWRDGQLVTHHALVENFPVP